MTDVVPPANGDDVDAQWAIDVTAQANNAYNLATSLQAPGWVDFSSTLAWSSTGTQPTFGNATKLAKYRRPSGSDMVDVMIKLSFGSTTTFGTGIYFFNLPVVAVSEQVTFGCGWGYALDAGTQEYGGIAKLESTTGFRIVLSAGGSWAATTPFTFGNGDVLAAQLRYRVA